MGLNKPAAGSDNPNETIQAQEKAMIGTSIKLGPNEVVVFGRDPNVSDDKTEGARLIEVGFREHDLAGDFDPRRLSRAIVEISTDEFGHPSVICVTENNPVWLSNPTVKTPNVPNGLVRLNPNEQVEDRIKQDLGDDFDIVIQKRDFKLTLEHQPGQIEGGKPVCSYVLKLELFESSE